MLVNTSTACLFVGHFARMAVGLAQVRQDKNQDTYGDTNHATGVMMSVALQRSTSFRHIGNSAQMTAIQQFQ